MTNDTDPNRALADEIAQLRRELAESRRDTERRLRLLEVLVDDGRRNVTYLFRDTQRLDRIHHKLRHTVREMTQRVDGTEAYLPHLADQIDQRLATAYEAIAALQTTAQRQDRTLQQTARRLDLAGQAVAHMIEHAKTQDRAIDASAASAEDYLRTLNMWVNHLALRAWPNAQILADDLDRIFPKGFSAVPNYRLGKKTPG